MSGDPFSAGCVLGTFFVPPTVNKDTFRAEVEVSDDYSKVYAARAVRARRLMSTYPLSPALSNQHNHIATRSSTTPPRSQLRSAICSVAGLDPHPQRQRHGVQLYSEHDRRLTDVHAARRRPAMQGREGCGEGAATRACCLSAERRVPVRAHVGQILRNEQGVSWPGPALAGLGVQGRIPAEPVVHQARRRRAARGRRTRQ